MSSLPLYNQILVAFINLIGLWLAFVVIRFSPLRWMKGMFLAMVILMFFWVDGAYFARLVGKKNIFLALILLKMAWFVTPLLFMCLYFLGVYLFGEKKKYSYLNKFVLISGFLASIVTGITNLVVKEIVFLDHQLSIVYGKGMLPFLGIVFFIMCATLFVLFKEYSKRFGETRMRIKYVLIGVFIFYLANIIFNIFFPLFLKIVRFYWIGDYSIIFLLSFIAYATIKHHLFRVRILFIWTAMFLAVIFFLVEVFTLTPNFLYQLIKIAFLSIFIYFALSLIKATELEIQAKENLKKAHQKLSIAYDKLKEVNQMKTEFISIASHQLKGPLGIIKGYLWMILNEKYGSFPKKIKKPLENVFKLNERLVKVVDDLLNLSRLELGKIKLEKEYFQIEEIIYNIYEELSNQAKEKGLRFIIKKPKEVLPKVFGDKLKIREAIFNIVDNAIKYTQKGFVKIEFFQKENLILIKVSDSGIGFSQEEAKNIFQSFRRIRRGAVLHTEGAGLGLYIAKKFIELHKGRVWAKSKGKNKGATFFIALPI